MQTIITLESSDPKQFEIDVNDYLKKGYRVLSTNCGFVNDSKYGYCSTFQAVLVCDIKEEKILQSAPPTNSDYTAVLDASLRRQVSIWGLDIFKMVKIYEVAEHLNSAIKDSQNCV